MQKEFDQIGGGGGGGGAAAAEDVMNRKPTTKPDSTSRNHRQQQQQQQHPQEPQQCPRCDSFNTKFCYYNNYSLSQPRFFCKACRRYWTRGGTLRNVPVGGGCRKGKRTKHSSSSSSAAAAAVSSHSLPLPRPQHNFASASNLLGLSPSPVLRAAKPPSENPLLQPMLAPYYGGATAGGFLSSLTSIQPQPQPQPQQQQHLSFSNSVGYYNSLNVLNGLENFSPPPSSFGGNYQNHQQRQIQQQQIQEQEECLEEKIPDASVLCPPPSDHQGNLLMNATVRDWDQQGFNYVSSSNPTVSSAPEFHAGDFWNTNPNPESSSSLNPSATHWPPHLP